MLFHFRATAHSVDLDEVAASHIHHELGHKTALEHFGVPVTRVTADDRGGVTEFPDSHRPLTARESEAHAIAAVAGQEAQIAWLEREHGWSRGDALTHTAAGSADDIAQFTTLSADGGISEAQARAQARRIIRLQATPLFDRLWGQEHAEITDWGGPAPATEPEDTPKPGREPQATPWTWKEPRRSRAASPAPERAPADNPGEPERAGIASVGLPAPSRERAEHPSCWEEPHLGPAISPVRTSRATRDTTPSPALRPYGEYRPEQPALKADTRLDPIAQKWVDHMRNPRHRQNTESYLGGCDSACALGWLARAQNPKVQEFDRSVRADLDRRYGRRFLDEVESRNQDGVPLPKIANYAKRTLLERGR